MTIKSFFKLVELPTKVASVFPFAVGTLYAIYRYNQFNLLNFLIMLVAMLCLDMATTALNNYMDYKLALKTHGFNYEQHNAIVKDKIKESTVKFTIGFLMSITVILGLVLVYLTDVFILLLGMVSFFFAVIYTWGPVPISRTPLGEIVSGTVMGGIIPLISLYIHIYDRGLIELGVNNSVVSLSLNFVEILAILVLTIPLIMGIAGIMLANNTCDMEDDFENRRFTLPLLIGKDKALHLFVGLYIVAYGAILVGVLLRWLPYTCLLVLATAPVIKKHTDIFKKEQTKKNTFIVSVKNFIILSAAYVLSLVFGILLA